MTLEGRCDSDKPAVFSFHFARRILPVAVTRIVFPFFLPATEMSDSSGERIPARKKISDVAMQIGGQTFHGRAFDAGVPGARFL